MAPRAPEIALRNQDILLARRRGVGLGALAEHYKISRQRVLQIYKDAERRSHGDPIWELSTRTRNVLVDCGCQMTPEGIAKRFAQFSPYQISRIVNFGAASKAELHAWLTRHLPDPPDHLRYDTLLEG